MHKQIFGISLLMTLVLSSCHYRKGTSFTWKETGDSVRFVVIGSGRGKELSERVKKLTFAHESRGDSCRTLVLGGPGTDQNGRQILLLNSVLPDMQDDMLSKGFMGTFSTRQKITYLLVPEKDMDKYLVRAKKTTE
jgi:hypothetical protein